MRRPWSVGVVVLGVGFATAACAVAIVVMFVRSAPPPPPPLPRRAEQMVIFDDRSLMPPDFSHAVSFPDGSHGQLRQSDIQPSERQGSAFFVDVVHPQGTTLHGILHLSESAVGTLETCPGETRQERSAAVTDAVVAWVREYDLKPDFELEVMVESGDRKPCRVSLFLQPPTPVAVRVGGSSAAPKRIKHVPAVYPFIARAAHVQGVVTIDAVIGPDGRVEQAKVLRSIPLLDAAAVDAVRKWVYAPTLVDGVPVSVIMTVRVNFTLP